MWSHVIIFTHDYLIVLKVWKDLYEWILGSIGFGGLMVFRLLCFPEMKKICLGIAVCLLITLRFIKVQQSKSLFLSIQYELLYCIFSDIVFSSQKSIEVLSLVGYKWKLSFGFWETRKQNGHLYMGPRNQLLSDRFIVLLGGSKKARICLFSLSFLLTFPTENFISYRLKIQYAIILNKSYQMNSHKAAGYNVQGKRYGFCFFSFLTCCHKFPYMLSLRVFFLFPYSHDCFQ